MKYICLRDLHTFFGNYKRYLLFYLFLLVCYILFENMIGISLEKELFLKTVGMMKLEVGDLFALLMLILNLIFYIFIGIKTFVNDIQNNLENIFLRMSTRKWCLMKFISILFLNFLVMSVAYGVIYPFFLKEIEITDVLYYFFQNIICFLTIEFILIFTYVLIQKLTIKKVVFALILIPSYILLILKEYGGQFIVISLIFLLICIQILISKNLYIVENIKRKE